MYYVIFCDDWCSTVLRSWVDLKNKTFYWPPKEINATGATIKNINPSDNWNMQVYRRIIGPYKTYEIARKIEKEAADISTSEEGRFENLNSSIQDLKKRLIKKPRFHNELDDGYNSHLTKESHRPSIPAASYVRTSSNMNIINDNDELDSHLIKESHRISMPASSYIRTFSNISVINDNEELDSMYIFSFFLHFYSP
ncbi:hypothetical protein ACFW04_010512 [Cataglyphis niger]